MICFLCCFKELFLCEVNQQHRGRIQSDYVISTQKKRNYKFLHSASANLAHGARNFCRKEKEPKKKSETTAKIESSCTTLNWCRRAKRSAKPKNCVASAYKVGWPCDREPNFTVWIELVKHLMNSEIWNLFVACIEAFYAEMAF